MKTAEIAAARRNRLAQAMAEDGVDILVVYGNAWQSDYLRYAADYGILEGEGLAVVRRDGNTTLFLDSALEAERAEVETSGIDIIHAPAMLAEVEALLERAGNSRIGVAPKRLMPQRLASRSKDLGIGDRTAMMDRLLMKKLDCEIAAMRAAAHMADEGYEVFRTAARAGRADYELVAEVEAFFRSHGVDDNFMIIGVGGKEVRGMAPPMGKKLNRGDLVTTELTPCINGYYLFSAKRPPISVPRFSSIAMRLKRALPRSSPGLRQPTLRAPRTKSSAVTASATMSPMPIPGYGATASGSSSTPSRTFLKT
jgi:Xaa-Pro dipeptidase